jgi:RHH-type transcriptional regulator, proline utilization regulon repressor / proline dehydrogenase / delta 1-pyrroline-5-carboxylate dehydrogenase
MIHHTAQAISASPWVDGPTEREPLRAAITAATRLPEGVAVQALLALTPDHTAHAAAIQSLAKTLAQGLRAHKGGGAKANIVQGLLHEYALSSQEGVALMCLAEALLRIPDAGTRDALIRDKISHGQWSEHLGQSPSLFVNAATWGLVLTGKLVSTHRPHDLSHLLGGLIRKGGEPLIRKGVDMAMRMMGEQFVTGETIALALNHARGPEAQGFRYSYDMLGEAAMTAEDAARYLRAYEDAIHAIGQAAQGTQPTDNPGISIKLSALHPRYTRAQYARVMSELYPRLLALTELAQHYRIGLNIDAEEADRLELSLDLLERLCEAPSLQGFDGIGFVIQAYQKRCPAVVDWVIALARRTRHRLMVRLVKGAYWDSEIKRAQIDGLSDYPVYTRKAHTDVSYLACARKLLAAPEAVYPQFATHNAHTVAAIAHLAGLENYQPEQYEFQCLHGMGEPLYAQVVTGAAMPAPRPCRIYAPVGSHETLLAYLVRRLLENGANTSFVNRVADASLSLDDLVADPLDALQAAAASEGNWGNPHPLIALPPLLYGAGRANAVGVDLSSESTLSALTRDINANLAHTIRATSLVAGELGVGGACVAVTNPADHRDVVGHVTEASAADVQTAIAAAHGAAATWAQTAPAVRAQYLNAAANAMEQRTHALMALLMREAGKTAANAVAEVREAVDFLRYYAHGIQGFDNTTHQPLGPVVCISPWNFPLAIFTGQIAAALAAGNTVLAKPAEQTPLIAEHAVRLLHQAGVPRAVLQLLMGQGHIVGAALVADARVQGVVFTGSTEVARLLQSTLAKRLNANGQPVPLIAETGGQNAMIVDSSALTEQVITDAIASAFDSAGQRCSALRVLCVQEDVAERVITMMKGAMAELRVGNPGLLATDVGPVIDADAQAQIQNHIEHLRSQGHPVHQSAVDASTREAGTFIAPTLIELPGLSVLQREVFGPVCHVVRYRREALGELIDQINATGYGLTLGLHTRMDETIAHVVSRARVGNVYVNRNQVGAVVGVQPFGGEGLSGTGPKAGGPLYLYRLLARRPSPNVAALLKQARQGITLTGPTGERNTYSTHVRDVVLCLADDLNDRWAQTQAALAVGSKPLWPLSQQAQAAALSDEVTRHIHWVQDWRAPQAQFDLVLHHGSAEDLLVVQQVLAQRDGPIVGVWHGAPGERDIPMERLMVERSVSVNTAAAGGNASLMALG